MKEEEIKKTLKTLHEDIVDNITDSLLKELIQKETYFAGGCFKSLLLDEKVNDYDLYFKSESAVKKFQELGTTGFNKEFDLKLSTKNAVTFEFKDKYIQFIVKFSGQPYQVINQFDFRHCQNFYNPIDNYLVIADCIIKRKELIYNSQSHLPISSIKRIGKFASQGWTIDDKEIVKLAVKIATYKLSDRKVLKEQVAGLNLSQFSEPKTTESEFEEIHDPVRCVRKMVNKLRGIEE
jgi:hypothetical protein